MADTPKSLKGTKTERNIVDAYLNESTAYTRYTFYAQQADKENYFPIGQIFRETADNELHHAKIFFKMLQGGKCLSSQLNMDAGVIADTASNLATAIAEERAEGYEAYMAAAKVARDEGFDDIADHFLAIASVERTHHARFERYLEQVKTNTVWKREKPIRWKCLVCGYEYVGTTPPEPTCPGCDHPYQHYMAMDEPDE